MVVCITDWSMLTRVYIYLSCIQLLQWHVDISCNYFRAIYDTPFWGYYCRKNVRSYTPLSRRLSCDFYSARSWDFSPIDYVWDILDARFGHKKVSDLNQECIFTKKYFRIIDLTLLFLKNILFIVYYYREIIFHSLALPHLYLK